MIIDYNQPLTPNKKRIFNAMDCYENSPIYNEVNQCYEELIPMIIKRMQPVIAYQFVPNDKKVLDEQLAYCDYLVCTLISLGHDVSQLTKELMDQDRYLEAVLMDTILDDLTFDLEKKAYEHITKEAKEKDLQLSKRFHPGDDKLALEDQRWILKEVDPFHRLEMTLTEGCMINPAKSLSFICGAHKQIREWDKQKEHNCVECVNKKSCKWKVADSWLTVIGQDMVRHHIPIYCQPNLLSLLIEHDLFVPSPCGGMGTCGKCTIMVLKGQIEPSSEDRKHLTKDQLDKGYRLACTAEIEESCTIQLLNQQTEMDVLQDYTTQFHITAKSKDKDQDKNQDKNQDESSGYVGYGIAIDIGTTTVAMQLINLKTGRVVDLYSCLNSQWHYGADVISRIQNANEGHLKTLQALIQNDLLTGIKILMEKQVQIKLDQQIESIVITGNTTMFHLLLGLSCETLGVYPFLPVSIDLMEYDFSKVFNSYLLKCKVTLLPAISAFVGADTVAGLYSCDFHEADDINLLVDIGTNGEMAVGNKDAIITTATAAGPAFEGGNISCGVGSVQGAISSIEYAHPYFHYKTIGDASPVGICGSGLLDLVAQGVRHGWIEETGALKSPFDDGIVPIYKEMAITQKDIREVQLAKAAIGAGIECLLQEYGCSYDAIRHVYLAGGFGFHLSKESAITIGLMPQAFQHKIKSIGNASLGGGVKYLLEQHSQNSTLNIVQKTRSIILSEVKSFNDTYIQHMLYTKS